MDILDIFTHTGPHLHILINHFPSMGAVFALGLLIISFWHKSEDLQRASLVIFALMALLAVPTYIAGAGARWAIQNDADVARAVIAVHQDSATWTFLFLGATGVIAWLGLWQAQRYSHVPKWNPIVVLVLGLITLAFLTRTGAIGGHINHLELGPVPGEVPGQPAHIETLMSNLKWAWPVGETVHFVGMSLIFGTVLLISARLLGLAKQVPYSALHRLLPIGVLGLLLNVLSGMYFFIADSGRYTNMQAFPLKIACLVIGGASLLYFTIFPGVWSVKAGDDAPVTAKLMALVALGSWAGVIVFGRLLPYYGSAGL
jgi:hypothetical protein